MSIPDKTYDEIEINKDVIVAKLIDILGYPDLRGLSEEKKIVIREEINKIMSQLTDEERESLLWKIDVYNTYRWEWLKSWIFDFLKLGVSLNRKGREEVKDIGKSAYNEQPQENPQRFKWLRDLFRG